jgi:hypothetical protein
MYRIPTSFIENITHIAAKPSFDIKFDSIKGVNINNDFFDIVFFKALGGNISARKNGIMVKYYDENNKLLQIPKISKFTKTIYENKKVISAKNIVKIKKNGTCKYITRMEIIFTYNNIDTIIFDSKTPQNTIFSENTNGDIKNGIAIPLNETNIELYNKFQLIYK